MKSGDTLANRTMKKGMGNYSEAIQAIKNAILHSRYRAASLANRELLSLYYGIGKYISENSRGGFWGTNAITTISERLQQELPGLRGFSVGNIKKMRLFYEQWCGHIENRSPSANDLAPYENRPLAPDEIRQPLADDLTSCENRQLVTGDLEKMPLGFLNIGFYHHYEIIAKTQSVEERLFYVERCASEFWSRDALRYHLKSKLYAKQGKLPNNFKATISDKDFQRKALLSFKDEYLLDFVNVESPDDEPDERVLGQHPDQKYCCFQPQRGDKQQHRATPCVNVRKVLSPVRAKSIRVLFLMSPIQGLKNLVTRYVGRRGEYVPCPTLLNVALSGLSNSWSNPNASLSASTRNHHDFRR